MSRFQQYLFLGGMLLLLQRTAAGKSLQSASFLITVGGIIAVLLLVAVLVTLPRMKEKWRERKKKPLEGDEGN